MKYRQMECRWKPAAALLVLALFLPPLPVSAQNLRTEHVSFAAGSTGTVIEGQLVGDRIIDYVVNAQGGQRMTVDMTTTNPSAYFNVMPSATPDAIHIGSSAGLRFDDTLPSGGNWAIRVYLMRNAARRNETADYTIAVSIAGSGSRSAIAPAAKDPEEVCRSAVISIANTSQVEVVGSDFSEAGTMVRLTVGSNRAIWQCIAYSDGSTAGVMFLGDDSAGTSTTPAPDYADGDAGGPDWWQVSGASSLNVRSGPGTGNAVIGKAAEGQLLRNLGC